MKRIFSGYPDLIYPLCKRTDENGIYNNFFHMHDRYEICFVRRGRVHVICDEVDIVADGPFAVLYKPYIMHSMSAEAGITYTRSVLYFMGEYQDTLQKEQLDLNSVYRFNFNLYELDEPTAEKIDVLMDMATQNGHLMYFLLGAVLKEIEKANERQLITVHGGKLIYISEVMKYICENYREELDTPALAKRFFVSVTKLNRDFREYTQSTVRFFIIKVRLQNAKLLLIRGVGVAETALKCGFRN